MNQSAEIPETLPVPNEVSRDSNDQQEWSVSNLKISFKNPNWIIEYKQGPNKMLLTAESPEKLASFLADIGTGKLTFRTETLEEAIARGVNVVKLPTRFAAGTTNIQNHHRHPLPPVKIEKRVSSLSAARKLSVEDLLAVLEV